ncbi:MAG: RagB/SusD family nutrient uptake outer membrane protein [Cyclobacteriaceae bacterium]|nr:RagB/SusD family nutrient uptake outer membrane protein [Cyclobacteriaceae bacterium]
MKRISIISIITVIMCTTACHEDWLEIKRDRSLIVPQTLKDMRLLLRHETLLSRDYISLLTVSSENFYVPIELFNTRSPLERNAYLWKDVIYEGQTTIGDWDNSYAQVLIANVVLEGLEKISPQPAERSEWNDVKGSALHLRARAFFNLAQTFAPAFQESTASIEQGIPLLLSSDPNQPVIRSTVADTYHQIITDFELASTLLRDTPEFIRDPSRPAALGWLARCYLSMHNYAKAFQYADAYLTMHAQLLDFNTLNSNADFPVPIYNLEVIHHTEINPLFGLFASNFHRVADTFRNSYDDNDLRKSVFYRNRNTGAFGTYGYKGSYTGGPTPFSGIATSEMYLIRSECAARSGNVDGALSDLNTLLEHRFVTGTFVPYTTANANQALQLILTERNKELFMRGLRWSDLRRLNTDPAFQTVVTRTIDGVDYTLLPGSTKYVLPIPDYIIGFSNIQQNPR